MSSFCFLPPALKRWRITAAKQVVQNGMCEEDTLEPCYYDVDIPATIPTESLDESCNDAHATTEHIRGTRSRNDGTHTNAHVTTREQLL